MTPEDKHELRLMIREEVTSVVAKLVETKSPQYVPTKVAMELLGYRSTRQLYQAVERGLLRIGREVQDRRSSGSNKANYYFDIPACQKRLQMVPEKRKS
jgi:hypothetical protein